MRLRPFTYLLAIIFVSLFCLFKTDYNELILAREEHLAALELQKKIERERYSLTRLGFSKKNVTTIPAQDIRYVLQPQHPGIALITIKPDGQVILSREFIKAIMHAISLEKVHPGDVIVEQNVPPLLIMDEPDGPVTITVIPRLQLVPPSKSLSSPNIERIKARQKLWDSLKDKQ